MGIILMRCDKCFKNLMVSLGDGSPPMFWENFCQKEGIFCVEEVHIFNGCHYCLE